MSARASVPRLLGATFLVVIVTSLISGALLSSAVGSGSVSDLLRHLADNAMVMRLSILAGMANSVGVVVLAALLYVLLKEQNGLVALVALGLWLCEAVLYAVSQVGSAGLIPLSHDFVKAGTPDPSYFQGLGAFLYDGIAKLGVTLHMFFYCTGGLLWYSLLYRARSIPSVIPAFGLAAVSLGLVGVVLQLLGNTVPVIAYIPLLPFELALGTWLLVKGIKGGSEVSAAQPRERSLHATAGGVR